MLYTIINPSDPYTVEANRLDVAAVASLLLGSGQYSFEPLDGSVDIPMFGFMKQEDIDKVYDHLNRNLGEKFCIHVEWPTNIPGYWETAPLR